MSDFEFSAKVSTEDVIRALTFLTYEDLMAFIVDLDDTIGDWDFTRMAYEYFRKEILNLDEEKGGGWH